ncbi:Cytochrome c oxidase assembly protein cox18, mitochondrial [Coemansia sp. Benny D115]|nr:Cytochrome c oxidase assembly protein cox18, mitochondrial [Coemansia sp. Benny D115]
MDVADGAGTTGSSTSSVTEIMLNQTDDGYPLILRVILMALERAHGEAVHGGLQHLPQALQAVSNQSTVPWWLVITGAAVVLRTALTLPLYVRQQRASETATRLRPVVEAWVNPMRETLVREAQTAGENQEIDKAKLEAKLKWHMRKKYHALMLQEGCHPVDSFLLPLVQMPLWMLMSFAIRHLAGRPLWLLDPPDAVVFAAPGMSTEGLLWFADLAATDPTAVLPALACALQLANVVVMHRRRRRAEALLRASQKDAAVQTLRTKLLQKGVLVAGYVTPLFTLYAGCLLPAAMPLYWSASAAFSLVQSTAFQNARVRGLFRLKPLPTGPVAPPP